MKNDVNDTEREDMGVYYNEFDKKKCAMLKQLMLDGHITKGDIDDRPIQEVQPEDLNGYTRCHFFAGIGLWDYALQLAGWDTDRPVWTGSCPCQPFSTAGRQKGKADDRHLWPEWERLVKECRPATIFGEQVSNAIGSENKNLSNMFRRIGTLELLLNEAERQEILSPRLQELRNKEKSTTQARNNRAEPFDADEMEREIERLNLMLRSEKACERQGSIIHADTTMGSREDRQGCMRTDRCTVQSNRRQNLGQSIDRQNNTREGLYESELSSGDIFSQCDDERLGGEQDYRNCQFYYGDQKETIRRLANEARREFDETITKGWLDDVYQGLEEEGYAVGSVVLPASAVGAPHRRERLWFVADSKVRGCEKLEQQPRNERKENEAGQIDSIGASASTMGDTIMQGSQGHGGLKQKHGSKRREIEKGHPWKTGVWINCPDRKQRIVEPTIPLLAHGYPHRVPILHAIGDGIVPQVAQAFIESYMEVENIEWKM